MMFEIRMPQWGMNMADGVIISWLKKEGDRIDQGEPLAEIEAAKATGTLDSPVAGVVAKLIGQVDDVIAVQELIALVETGE